MRTTPDSWFKGLVIALAAVLLWSLWASAQPAGVPDFTTVQFAQRTFTVGEHSGGANVVIRRTGPTNAAVTVRFTTTDDTAISGVNYAGTNTLVTIDAGAAEETVRLSVFDDLHTNATRRAVLALTEPVGAVLGAAGMAELLILDNDAAQSAWLSFGLDRIPIFRRAILEIPFWQYVASLLYIFLAFYVSKLLDLLLRGQFRRWAERTSTKLDDMVLELLRGPIKIVVFVVLLHIGLKIFSWPAWFEDFFSGGLKIVVACSLTYVALRFIDLLLLHWKDRRAEDDKSFNNQLLPIIRNTLKVFVVVVAVLVTLQNLGLNVTSLIASLSIGGLALSLAAQDTLSNLFGAIAVLTDRPFRVGDRIKVDTIDGTVESIGLRSTRVRNLDGHLVTIPNKTMGNTIVTNITSRPNIRTIFNISITYNTPAEKVKRALAILEEVYRAHPMTHDVIISFNLFADSSLNIQVIYWWKSTDFKAFLGGMQELNLTVKQRFDAESIDFAFPTRTLYLKQDPDWVIGPPGGVRPT